MQKIPTILVLAVISVSGVACKSNKAGKSDPYATSQPTGSQDPYASTGEYDNVYASGGGQSYGSDDYYNTASSNPYTPPSNGGGGASSQASSGGSNSHTVVKGDTLFNISRRYGTTVGAIQSANGINGDLIRLGERLVIP